MPKADEKHSMAMGNLCPKSSQQVRMQLPTKGPTLRDESVMNFVSFADGICTFVNMFFRWSLFASLYMMFITSSKVGRSLEKFDTSTHHFFAIDGVAGFGDLHPRPGILRGHSLQNTLEGKPLDHGGHGDCEFTSQEKPWLSKLKG